MRSQAKAVVSSVRPEGYSNWPESGRELTHRILQIGNETLSLSFSPDFGGSILRFKARTGAGWVSILRDSPEQLRSSSDCASFLMAPYPNRVRDGRFTFEGRDYQLANPEKHAIHGCVRNRPWEVASFTDSSAVLSFSSESFDDIDFPFPFEAKLTYKIEGCRMTWEVAIENCGAVNMPAGFGFHPYFRNSLSDSEMVSLKFHAAGYYPTAAKIPIPTGAALPLTSELDFSRGRKPADGLDHCLSGWDGLATLTWSASKVQLTMAAGPGMEHLVIYKPPGSSDTALEPQSMANDGLNLSNRGIAGSGVQVLRPGERCRGQVEFTLQEI